MHSKFIIRVNRGRPVAVWTGSFNFTVNASASNIENAVEIHDPVIAGAYLDEFARIAATSEPLNFTAGKADPTWSGPATGTRKVPAKPARKATQKTAAASAKPSRTKTVKAGSRAHKGRQATGNPSTTATTRATTTAKKGRRR